MNFLAHLYLSKDNQKIMIGNFIADAIKGNNYSHFTPEIQKGIILHRHIDTYTDQHPIVRQSKRRLHKRYGHYTGVIIDLFYDHFLAKNWSDYCKTPLDIYSKIFYSLLHEHYDILPDKTKQMLPYLEQYNWLYNYQFLDGMQQVLEGMNRRTKMKSQMHLSIKDLKEHYQDFEDDFALFFKDLITFTKNKTIIL
ncbi:MAG: ACP phosphodiesterase [Urechidicola sp.]|nr:ACP phosphodiesterase [Urechidicola sp.]